MTLSRGQNAWYGVGAVLGFRKWGVVRPEYSAGCTTEEVNLFGGVPRGWGADWQDLAWGRGTAQNLICWWLGQCTEGGLEP